MVKKKNSFYDIFRVSDGDKETITSWFFWVPVIWNLTWNNSYVLSLGSGGWLSRANSRRLVKPCIRAGVSVDLNCRLTGRSVPR